VSKINKTRPLVTILLHHKVAQSVWCTGTDLTATMRGGLAFRRSDFTRRNVFAV